MSSLLTNALREKGYLVYEFTTHQCIEGDLIVYDRTVVVDDKYVQFALLKQGLCVCVC